MTTRVQDDAPAGEMRDRTLTDEELEDLTAHDSSPVAVTYSSQDFDVAGLVKRLERGQMLIPQFGGSDDRITTAGFQRGFVWNKAQMDRFIESLLLGYPVPGIFLIKQSSDNRLLVLDGQQRLITLKKFHEGMYNGKEFTLQNVGGEFKGLSYKSLDESLQFKLDDSFLQATIVIADGSSAVNDAIYQIFERLNSGGTQLTPHEIRVALYAGPLIEFMETLNKDVDWRHLYGKKSPRIRDQELIMRILALYIEGEAYTKPLKGFLNKFVDRHRHLSQEIKDAGGVFIEACGILSKQVGPSALRRPGGSQPNVAQSEAVLVGMMRVISDGQAPDNLNERLDLLKNEEEFIQATTRFTSDKDTTEKRLRLATLSFGS